MAKHPYGVLGPFIGRLGPTVGYMLGDINVSRTIGKYHGPRTPKQFANETRMALVSSLSGILEEFLNFGLRAVSGIGKQDPRNHFIKLNKQKAVKGEYPQLETDFGKLIVADGNIPAPKNGQALLTGNRLKVSWKADMAAEGTNERDQVMILAYFPSVKKAVTLASGARRSAETESINLPEFELETAVEVYMAFVADNRLDASPSVYLGQLLLNEGVRELEEGFKFASEAVNKETGEIYYDPAYQYVHVPAEYDDKKPEQVHKVKKLSPMLRVFKNQINIGYPEGGKLTQMNKAMSYNLLHAIKGEAPRYHIDFPKLKLSWGKRETAWSTKMVLNKGNKLQVKWAVPETANMKLIGDDIACVMVYNQSRKRAVAQSYMVTRKDLSCELTLRGVKPGDDIHAWIFFYTPDKSQASNTDYLGSLTIPKK